MERTSTQTIKSTNFSPQLNKVNFSLGAFLLFLAVLLGAFGAHGLEGKISERALATFKTGNLYHFFHAFGLFIIGITSNQLRKNFKVVVYLNLIGITLFSFFCYAYALTGIKTFAMIVPLGGTCFLISWLIFSIQIIKQKA